ncbi:MAG: 2-oxo-4-hydroxy-4-carboxy-5-ureidoimidazoline decarboxylase [Verrucomicrobiales bacterium]
MASLTIEEINGLTPAEFVELFGGVYNGSWWVAESAESERPFLDVDHLLLVMRGVVDEADEEQCRGAMGDHPDLEDAHNAARRDMRGVLGSEFSVQLSLPAWVDEMVTEAPIHFSGDEEKMAFVIDLSRRNVLERTGGPFGAAIFEIGTGRLVAPGVNVVVAGNTSLAHAEAMAFMLAQQELESFDLGAAGFPPMEIVASSQPCIQCYGMTWWSGVQRLVIGACADDVEKLTGFAEGPLPANWVETLEKREAPLRAVEVKRDVLAEEACQVLELYRDRGGFVYNAGSG